MSAPDLSRHSISFAVMPASSSCCLVTTPCDRFAEAPKGEIVLVVGPEAGGHEAAPLAAIAAVHRLVDAGAKPREAAKVVADLTGASANALYDAVAG